MAKLKQNRNENDEPIKDGTTQGVKYLNELETVNETNENNEANEKFELSYFQESTQDVIYLKDAEKTDEAITADGVIYLKESEIPNATTMRNDNDATLSEFFLPALIEYDDYDTNSDGSLTSCNKVMAKALKYPTKANVIESFSQCLEFHRNKHNDATQIEQKLGINRHLVISIEQKKEKAQKKAAKYLKIIDDCETEISYYNQTEVHSIKTKAKLDMKCFIMDEQIRRITDIINGQYHSSKIFEFLEPLICKSFNKGDCDGNCGKMDLCWTCIMPGHNFLDCIEAKVNNNNNSNNSKDKPRITNAKNDAISSDGISSDDNSNNNNNFDKRKKYKKKNTKISLKETDDRSNKYVTSSSDSESYDISENSKDNNNSQKTKNKKYNNSNIHGKQRSYRGKYGRNSDNDALNGGKGKDYKYAKRNDERRSRRSKYSEHKNVGTNDKYARTKDERRNKHSERRNGKHEHRSHRSKYSDHKNAGSKYESSISSKKSTSHKQDINIRISQ